MTTERKVTSFPPVDPETVLLLSFFGALTGAITFVAGYYLERLASEQGKSLRGLPEAPPFFRQE